MKKQVPYLLLTSLSILACSGCPKKVKTPEPSTSISGDGTVMIGGAEQAYSVQPNETHLYLLEKKSSSAPAFFHHHAVAAMQVAFEFGLDKDNPDNSFFNATIQAAGLDTDGDSFKGAFPETANDNFTASEKSDIRTNMGIQVGKDSYPTMVFRAHNLTTLDGDGTAPVDVELHGGNSTLTMSATAAWAGDVLTITGTGTLEGGPHNIPNGTFAPYLDNTMKLDLKLVLAPGHVDKPDAGEVDAGKPLHNPDGGFWFYPDTVACGTPGWPTVSRTLLVHCANCHGTSLTQGATIPLVTWHDYHSSGTLSSEAVFTTLTDRLVDPAGRKMPPNASTQFSATDLALVQAWVAGGAPENDCNSSSSSSTGGVSSSGGASSGGPCIAVGFAEVQPILHTRCDACHTGTAAGGGGVKLDTYASGMVMTNLPAYAGMTRWQVSGARMLDGTMPPGGGAQADPGATAFNAWANAGAPEFATCTGTGSSGGMASSGPRTSSSRAPRSSSTGGAVDAGPPPACGAVGYVDIQPIMTARCNSCHAGAAAAGGGAPLDSYAAGFVATNNGNYAGMNRWQSSNARMIDNTMPPGGGAPAADRATMAAWVAGGMPNAKCSGDGGVILAPDAGPTQPFDAGPPVCAVTTITANQTNSNMAPGGDCMGCHNAQNQGPPGCAAQPGNGCLLIAGTIMANLRSGGAGNNRFCPDLNAAAGSLEVKITEAAPATDYILPVTTRGNFQLMWGNGINRALRLPYTAAVRRAGGAWTPMATPQTEGSCNACHTYNGLPGQYSAPTAGSPGRIIVP